MANFVIFGGFFWWRKLEYLENATKRLDQCNVSIKYTVNGKILYNNEKKKCATVVSPLVRPLFCYEAKSIIRGMTFLRGQLCLHFNISAWTDKKGGRDLIRGPQLYYNFFFFFVTMGSRYYYVDKRFKIGKELGMIRGIFDMSSVSLWLPLSLFIFSDRRTLGIRDDS